jgi:hypothetical protein
MRIPLPRARRAPLGALAGAVIALAGVPAAAQAACPTSATAQAFAAFGDTAQYSSVPNGDFETGTGGWSLTPGATVAAGNEPWYVGGANDHKSLAIPAGGVAMSNSLCVSEDHPTFRFFARRTSGTWGTLNVKLLWKDSSGRTNTTTVASINGSDTAWHPTDPLALASALPLSGTGQTLQVQLVFDPEDFGGAWAIDDVYVDPWNRG